MGSAHPLFSGAFPSHGDPAAHPAGCAPLRFKNELVADLTVQTRPLFHIVASAGHFMGSSYCVIDHSQHVIGNFFAALQELAFAMQPQTARRFPAVYVSGRLSSMPWQLFIVQHPSTPGSFEMALHLGLCQHWVPQLQRA